MINDFTLWDEYTGASEGSGRSDKIWLKNPENGEIGLFKFNKTNSTTEHLSEKIASDLANVLEIECSKIDLGTYNSRIGSISYLIVKNNKEELKEGIDLIGKYYPDYDPNTLYDKKEEKYYSLEMIMKSLDSYSFKNEFFNIMMFDYLIGNTDRHQNNWAIIINQNKSKLSPLYDNGSSLCSYNDESSIESLLGNDKRRFNALVDSKSTSRIRINSNIKKEPTHKEVVEYLKRDHYPHIKTMMHKIKNNLNVDVIDEILQKYNEKIMSTQRKKLIKKYLLKKIDLL